MVQRAPALDPELNDGRMSSDESKQERLAQLRAEAVRLLDLARNPRRRRKALDHCLRIFREIGKLETENLHLRTLEEAYKDLSAGRLR